MKNFIKIFLGLTLLVTTLLAKDIATITALNGSAFIQRDGKKIPLHLGDKLQESDKVITDSDAKVQIIFSDDTIITLGKNSDFSVKEFVFEDAKPPVANFSMLQGAMRTITGGIGKVAPQRFSVATKTATIGIRGTNFTVLANADGSQKVFCSFGAIGVKTKGGEQVVKQGFYADVSAGGMVKVKKFTSKELKSIKKANFASAKNNKKQRLASQEGDKQVSKQNRKATQVAQNGKDKATDDGGELQEDTQLDTTQGDIQEVAIDDVVSETADIVQQNTEISADILDELIDRTLAGYGMPYFEGSSIFIMNGVFTKDDNNNIKLTDGSITQGADFIFTIAPMDGYSDELESDFNGVVDNTVDEVIEIYHDSSNYIDEFDSDSDYARWGEWSVSYSASVDGDESDYVYGGLWVAGEPTPVDVIDSMNGTVTYSGSYKAYDYANSSGDLIDGDASLDVDFGNDSATLHIDYDSQDNTFDMTIDGNTMADSNNGSAEGTFYGPNAEYVGGEFILTNDTGDSVDAQGVYIVEQQ